ncbi:MAG: hypothetical protein LBS40_02365, partial [Burkholderiales bacterium]|nr:hypothetical protein [Burkholderiales bacterium]
VTGPNHGGAIYTVGTVNVSNSTFEGNQTSFGNGGAIRAGFVNVSGSTFKNNHAGGNGGAIYAYSTTANVSNSTFENNQASYNGGAIFTINANISNSTFEGNQANNGDGGAICAVVTLKASHLTLLDNSATTSGAAIYHQGSGNARIDNSLILSSTDLADAPTLCAVGDAGSIGGSYNIEWVNGADTTSCNGVSPVSGGSGAIGAIVETTLADNGGPTPTLALPAGSPAIGAVDPGGATSRMLVIDFSSTPVTATWEDATLDQRGVTRATTTAERSLGAFEYKAPPAPIPVLPISLALLLALGVAGVGFRGQRTEDRSDLTKS